MSLLVRKCQQRMCLGLELDPGALWPAMPPAVAIECSRADLSGQCRILLPRAKNPCGHLLPALLDVTPMEFLSK